MPTVKPRPRRRDELRERHRAVHHARAFEYQQHKVNTTN
jgi:hypothetical protein